MTYDLLIVGAGPAGLSAAIRFKQMANAAGKELSVCVLEKGSQVSAHILSGAVIDPIALNELIPEWKEAGAPLTTPVSDEKLSWLTQNNSYEIPAWLLPPVMHNQGCYIGSLGELCQWMGNKAEELGVEIYPGFAAVDLVYAESGAVAGVVTGDMGLSQAGEQKLTFTPGIEIHAAYTLIAEGTRGSLTKIAEEKFGLRDQNRFQKYGLGIKEIWEVSAEKHKPGLVEHSLGWPLNDDTGGGSFLYHYGKNLVSIGYVVHLDYANPYLSPFEEFQRFKLHVKNRALLEGGKRIAYGARAISEGGVQSLPELVFDGGVLLGCAAGMVNVPRIKGSHNAMKSGMLAAEAAYEAITAGRTHDRLEAYQTKLKLSWIWQDLYGARNVKPYLSTFGTVLGSFAAGIELWLGRFGISVPWTLGHAKPDHLSTKPASSFQPIAYPKPDGRLSFDRLSSLALANIGHEHDQPSHLQIKDGAKPIEINLKVFDSPEQRYCPAGVYEIVSDNHAPRLQINAQNCVHCKTCDIKDSKQNIAWVTPEGGSGPNYLGM
ncbi:electron transfer flavoprotein-ubiquinone oxidoreductase [Novimethylophilus kurashikiensis]|nr:electron transfer flavoprotein-ubiquinone oxidoreductase [Novimethylophilus kurashikiensis]